MNASIACYAEAAAVTAAWGAPALDEIVFPPCLPDTRANRLESFAYRQIGSATIIHLCTASDVVEHLGAGFVHLGHRVSRVEVTNPDDLRKWTHALEIDSTPGAAGDEFLDLLHRALTLHRRAGLESALALDWNKDPSSHQDPNQWAYTEVGGLVARAKYGHDVTALGPLSDRLAQAIGSHPIYRECVLASVPGHDTTLVSNGERLAALVAKRTGLPLINTKARTPVRPEAKSGATFDLTDEFSMDEQATLRRVLVVDDLYHSGKTMSAVAAAAKRARALSVHGIVGVRIMRR